MGQHGRALGRVIGAVVLAAAATACTGGPGGPSASPPAPAGPAFAGTWKTVLTAADWEGVGIPNVDENTGEIALTFHPDGTWVSVQTSLTGVVLREPVFNGTYTSDATSIRMVTAFPKPYEGAVDVLRWRLEGDQLHLEATEASDVYVKVIYGKHPWQRA